MDTTTVGTYTVTYNASDAAGNNATEVTRTVNVVDTLSASNYEMDNLNAYIFPNPAYEFIKISKLDTLAKYNLYNINGQRVKSGDIDSNSQIDIQNLDSGIYILTINEKLSLRFLKK